jgi:transmembrane sensor
MENNIAKSLLDKYIAGTCTHEECAIVEAWYAQWNQEFPAMSEEQLQLALARVAHSLPEKEEKNRFFIKWQSWAAAAAIILVASLGTWFFTLRDLSSSAIVSIPVKRNDVSPGGNKAVLTLADGKRIKLSNAKTGVVIDVNKLSYDDGSVVSPGQEEQALTSKTLTVTTPRGGTYKIILPDGTQVWLNAASGIKFPSSFQSTATRTVKLIGEAYFEVAKDKSKPFIVETDQQKIEVLGTHFNVNSYSDEQMTRTTLLEGSIRLKVAGQEIILKPDHQAVLNGRKIEVNRIDTEETIAWKNGYFIFNDEDLESIMRKVSRWYNVEVYYQDKLPKMSFLGALSRSKNLSALLKVLEQSGRVHFKVEGRRITVMD